MVKVKVKVKVKMYLFLTKYRSMKMYPLIKKFHALKTYWGVEVKLCAFSNSALDDGYEWSAININVSQAVDGAHHRHSSAPL
jgi:hypothetical protein